MHFSSYSRGDSSPPISAISTNDNGNMSPQFRKVEITVLLRWNSLLWKPFSHQ